MTGRAIRLAYVGGSGPGTGDPGTWELLKLSEQNLAQVVLQQERVGNAEAGKQPNDVAVEQDRLTPARRGVRTMAEVHLVHDDEFRVARVTRLRGAEKREQRAVGPQDPRQLGCERLRRGLVEIIDQVPAQ